MTILPSIFLVEVTCWLKYSSTAFTCRLALRTTDHICFTRSSPRYEARYLRMILKFSNFYFYVGVIQFWIFKNWGILVTSGVFSMLFPICNFRLQQRKGPGSERGIGEVLLCWKQSSAQGLLRVQSLCLQMLTCGSCEAALAAESWK